METLRTQSLGSAGQVQQPKKLSAIGQWLRDNPNGIITVIDRKAVNK